MDGDTVSAGSFLFVFDKSGSRIREIFHKLIVDDEEIDVFGVSWAGQGRGIRRVDISVDGGKLWHQVGHSVHRHL